LLSAKSVRSIDSLAVLLTIGRIMKPMIGGRSRLRLIDSHSAMTPASTCS